VTGATSDAADNVLTRVFMMEEPYGFHARPAALFIHAIQRFNANVMVRRKRGGFVNGKSIMGLLTLELLCGDEVVVTAEGAEAAEALAAIDELFAGNFGLRKSDARPALNLVRPIAASDAWRRTAQAYA
jgi:phosphotransferase system HPr (HPr) family protein